MLSRGFLSGDNSLSIAYVILNLYKVQSLFLRLGCGNAGLFLVDVIGFPQLLKAKFGRPLNSRNNYKLVLTLHYLVTL